MKKFLLGLLIGISFVCGTVYAVSILTGQQGGTGFGDTNVTAGDIGKVLTVSTVSPHLTYTLSTGSSGSGGSGNVSTSTTETAGQLAVWTSNGATPALLGKVATTTGTCTGNVSCSPFVIIGAVPITINGTGSTFSGAANSVVVTDAGGGLIATGTQLTVGSILGTTTNVSFLPRFSSTYSSTSQLTILSKLFDASNSSGTDGFTLAVVNGSPTWVATTTLSTISGTLGVTKGGTGLTSVATGDLLYGSNTNVLSNRTATTNGFTLALVNGLPTWVATTTAGTGLTYTGSAFNVNTSQNISTLSNLTTNGLVTTSGGTGALGVTANSTNGFILAMSNGIPTWISTSTSNALFTTKATIWIDSSRTDSYTADGTIQRPYTTVTAANSAVTTAGYTSATYNISPGTSYAEQSYSFPNIPLVIRGNGATLIMMSAASLGAGTMTIPSDFDFYDAVIFGNVVASASSLSNPHTFSNSFIAGNVSFSGNAIFTNGAVVDQDTAAFPFLSQSASSTVSIRSGALANFLSDNIQTVIDVQGIINLDDVNVQTSTSTRYAITATTTGSAVRISGASIQNFSTGGLIDARNGASNSSPNVLASIVGTEGAGSIKGIEAGTASTYLSDYVIYTVAGVRLYATPNYAGGSTGLQPFSQAGLNVEGNSLLNILAGNTGLGTSTPAWGLQSATSTASTTFRPQIALTDTGAGVNLKHWTLASEGGNFYISTSSDTFSTSSIAALSITSVGTTTIKGLNILGGLSGTSTSAVGWNITTGCYAIAGTCLSTSGGTGLTSYNAWPYLQTSTQSGTTTRILLYGNASSTGFSSNYAGFGQSATTTVDIAGNISLPTTAGIYCGANLMLLGDTFKTLIRPCSSGGPIQIQSFAGGVNTSFLDNGNVGVATATPTYLITGFSATSPQLALSAGGLLPQLTFRNDGTNFYISTTTVAGTATTSISALEIALGGFGTTTLRGLNVSGFATSTSNVGYNITTGCYAISNVCISGSVGGSTNPAGSGSEIQYRLNATTFGAIPLTGTVLTGNSAFVGHGTTTPKYLLQLASSTESQLALTSGLNDAHFLFRVSGNSLTIATSTPTAFATTSVSNIFNLNQNGALCIGLGCTPMTTSGLYIRDQEGTGPTLYMGGNPGGDTDYQFKRFPNNDTLSNDRLSLGIGDIGNNPTEILTVSSNYTSGFGTTTPSLSILNLSSSTIPQLSLQAGSGLAQWAFRNAGGNFYLGTTTVAGMATTSISALEIDGATGTTTIRGLNILAKATSTSNVGFSITTGCYAIGTTCISGSAASSLTYDAWTHLLFGGANSASFSATTSAMAISTSSAPTNISAFISASSTASQLGLSAAAGFAMYTMRNAGGNFYLGTTTIAGTATTTVPAITVLNNGGVGVFDSTPDYTFESNGSNTNGFFALTKTTDGDIFAVNSSGFVGMGTSTPPSNLTLGATSAQLISTTPLLLLGTSTLSGASAGGTYFAINSPTGFAGDYINIQNNNTASLKVSQSSSGFGVFALGTTTFGAVPGKLVIATSTTAQLTLTDGLGGSTPFNFRVVGSTFNLSTSSVNSQATSTGSVMRVDSTGGVFFNGTANSGASQTGYWCYDANGQLIRDTAVCLVSARKFKTDIKPLTVGLDDLEKMDFVSYLKKEPLSSEDSHRQMGVIADDVAEINPALNEMLVTYVGGGTSGEVHAFRYDQFTALLGQSIKDLSAKVKNIKGVARSAEENWQWIAMFIMFCWIIRLEIKTRK